jgi:hypothetical protein
MSMELVYNQKGPKYFGPFCDFFNDPFIFLRDQRV